MSNGTTLTLAARARGNDILILIGTRLECRRSRVEAGSDVLPLAFTLAGGRA